LHSTQLVRKRGTYTAIGYTLSTAIALELLVPHSSLHSSLQSQIERQFVSIPKLQSQLMYCSTKKEFNSAPVNAVGVAHDDISKGRKYGDIVFSHV